MLWTIIPRSGAKVCKLFSRQKCREKLHGGNYTGSGVRVISNIGRLFSGVTQPNTQTHTRASPTPTHTTRNMESIDNQSEETVVAAAAAATSIGAVAPAFPSATHDVAGRECIPLELKMRLCWCSFLFPVHRPVRGEPVIVGRFNFSETEFTTAVGSSRGVGGMNTLV